MNSRVATVLRLRAAELEAERRYGEAVRDSDITAARNASLEWRKAAAVLARYVGKHPLPQRTGV
jgi:hypothetical protein